MKFSIVISVISLIWLCESQDISEGLYRLVEGLSVFGDSSLRNATSHSGTKFQCVFGCTREDGCRGFAHDHSTGSCVLIGEATLPGDDVTQEAVAAYTIYKRGRETVHSFKCTSVQLYMYNRLFAVKYDCFNELQGMCYKYILPGDGITWADAEQYCIDHFDGHLASPTTQETSDHVLAICE